MRLYDQHIAIVDRAAEYVDFEGRCYRLEPIVDLLTGDAIGHELLAGAQSCPFMDLDGWRAFYRFLESEVPVILSRIPGLLFINVDGAQMLDPEIGQSLSSLDRFGQRLALEWTEQSFHDDMMPDVLAKIAQLKSAGFLLAVDDIGAGVDGMGRAHSCRPHFGKIDGQMLRRARNEQEGRHLFMRGMADSLKSHGIKVIVEWIETEDDRHIAIAAGAHYGQGYLWTRAWGSCGRHEPLAGATPGASVTGNEVAEPGES